MDKVLTIIIPSYNMENYLERCLSSLVLDAEWMCLFEALVINDGSKDCTSEIGHAFEQRFPDTFRVIDKENGHYGSCINKGIEEARGSFIKVLDADDTFDPKVFAAYLDFLKQEDVRLNADAILSDYVQVDDNLSLIDKHPYGLYENPFALNALTDLDRRLWFIHALTYRTKMLRDMHYRQTEGVPYTDIEWCYYPTAAVKTLYRFHGYLYRYTKLREEQSVAPAVQGRNIDKQIGLVEKMIHQSQGITPFQQDLLKLNISHIYQLCLLTLHKYIRSDHSLLEFDRALKSSTPALYQEMSDYQTVVAGTAVKPVKLWREHHILRLKLIQYTYSLADIKAGISKRIRIKHS